MFCTECGKKNPDGAKFCAYCGAKIVVEPVGSPAKPAEPFQEEPAQIPAEQGTQSKVGEPKAQPKTEETELQPKSSYVTDIPNPFPNYVKPRTVQPTAVNPAQPQQASDTTEKPAPAQKPAPVQKAEPARKTAKVQPAKPSANFPAPQPPPWEIDTEEDEPVEDEQTPSVLDKLKGAARSFAEKKKKEAEKKNEAVTLQGIETIPGRSRPGRNTLIPKRFAQPVDDEELDNAFDVPEREERPDPHFVPPRRQPLHTEDNDDDDGFYIPDRGKKYTKKQISDDDEDDEPKPPKKKKTVEPKRSTRAWYEDDDDDDDTEPVRKKHSKSSSKHGRKSSIDDDYVNNRVHATVAAIIAVTALVVILWLFASASGRMFLAGFNLSSDAQAYRAIGDTALANNQVKRAADAYYRALALDPDDYDTALLVGKTRQQIADYDIAVKAYYKCITMRPSEPEPYECIIRLYDAIGDTEHANFFRGELIGVYEYLISVRPYDPEPYAGIIRIYDATGDIERANYYRAIGAQYTGKLDF